MSHIKRKGLGANVALATAGVVFAAMVGFASNASASVLTSANSPVVPTGLSILPAGDSLIVTETNAFTGMNSVPAVVFTGELTSSVYSDPNTGGLDFLYQLSNDPNSKDEFDELDVKDFSGFTTDVDYVNGTGAVNPDSATRSIAPGKLVSFFFNSGVPQGKSTSELLVETNSLNYKAGVGSVIDGGTGGALAEAPAVGMLMNNVPEPASFSAILIAGGMLLGRRRR